MNRLAGLGIVGVLAVGAQIGAQSVNVFPWPPGQQPQFANFSVQVNGTNFNIVDPASGIVQTAISPSSSQAVQITILTPGTHILACGMKTSTAFTGVASLTSTLGVTGNLTACVSNAYNLEAAVGSTNFAIPGLTVPLLSYNGTDAVVLSLTATGNLTSLTAGAVGIELLWAVNQ